MSGDELRPTLEPVLELLANEPASLTSVRDPERAWAVHVEDSLDGLDAVGRAERIVDIGAGAGFPGLVLAAALPASSVDLVESVARKARFIERAIEVAGLDNARVVHARSEDWARTPAPSGGREAYGVATARAVGPLTTLAELAAPLLGLDGVLVAWKGRRDPAEEDRLATAAPRLSMSAGPVRRVAPRPHARERHLHLIRKTGPTPQWLPRRPGLASRRPIGPPATDRGRG